MSLQQFIYPLSNEEFILEQKGEMYFIQQGDPGRFKSLFTWEQLNEIFFSHRLAYPRLRLIRDGSVIDPSLYLTVFDDKRGGTYSKVDSKKLESELKKGTAVHILSVQEFSPDLNDACARIADELSCEVSMTMHIGINESRAFDCHWDAHDVFVVQLHGKKYWKLYGFTDKYPVRTGPSQKEKVNLDCVWEGDLNEGDVMYLPRGYWHEAQAYDEASMHLSIGMYNPRPLDYIKWVSLQMAEFEFFRKDLPVALNADETGKYLSELKDKMAVFFNEKTYKAYLQQSKSMEQQNNFSLPYNKKPVYENGE